MESLLGPTLANAFFHVFMNRFDLRNVLMNSNLYATEHMLMTYLFCFVHLVILRNSKILNIEALDSLVRKNIIITCLF